MSMSKLGKLERVVGLIKAEMTQVEDLPGFEIRENLRAKLRQVLEVVEQAEANPLDQKAETVALKVGKEFLAHLRNTVRTYVRTGAEKHLWKQVQELNGYNEEAVEQARDRLTTLQRLVGDNHNGSQRQQFDTREGIRAYREVVEAVAAARKKSPHSLYASLAELVGDIDSDRAADSSGPAEE